jgi:hypothetical protein
MKAHATKAARERKKNCATESDHAVTSMQPAMAACVARIQLRLVEFVSTSGPQNILMTQGRYSQLVQKAIVALSDPNFL